MLDCAEFPCRIVSILESRDPEGKQAIFETGFAGKEAVLVNDSRGRDCSPELFFIE